MTYAISQSPFLWSDDVDIELHSVYLTYIRILLQPPLEKPPDPGVTKPEVGTNNEPEKNKTDPPIVADKPAEDGECSHALLDLCVLYKNIVVFKESFVN